ncbi:hypothetical protein [Pontibacter liquoris]|uniref:hypothetical protein n=1 Tax=Pontibacter liquoris TaxID=2905677 RepID=UPI001FA703E4|nr:hypothetical protein [Pontibacter liquoris]
MKQTRDKVLYSDKANDPKAESQVHKDRFLGALKQNSEGLNKDELGQKIGFSKSYTGKIIQELVSEGKITPDDASPCGYKPKEETK